MQKYSKKFIALLTAALLTVCMIPATVFAAGTDVVFDTATLGGEDITLGTGYADQDALDTDLLEEPPTGLGSVTIDAATASTVIEVSGGDYTSQFKVVKVAADDLDGAVAAVQAASVGEDLTDVSFSDGDYLIIEANDFDDPDNNFYYYVIKVTNSYVAPQPPAPGSNEGTLEFEPEVEDVTYVVTVPSNLAYAIDPFQLGTELVAGSQVGGISYGFTNASLAPVLLNIDFTATLGSDVTLVANASTLKPDDTTEKTKQLYLAALGAKNFTDASFAGLEYAADQASLLAAFKPTDKTASLSFVLNKGDGATAANANNAAAFTFYGILNTYAAWADTDVTIKAEYTFNALRPATYVSYAGDATVTPAVPSVLVGKNQISTGGTSVPGGSGTTVQGDITLAAADPGTTASPKAVNLSKTSVSTAGGIKIVLAAKPASITSVSRQNAGGTSWSDVTSAGYTYDNTTGLLTYTNALPGTAAYVDIQIVAGGTTYVVRANLSA